MLPCVAHHLGAPPCVSSTPGAMTESRRVWGEVEIRHIQSKIIIQEAHRFSVDGWNLKIFRIAPVSCLQYIINYSLLFVTHLSKYHCMIITGFPLFIINQSVGVLPIQKQLHYKFTTAIEIDRTKALHTSPLINT